MNKDQAMAIGLTWLNGPYNKPYVQVAKALQYLRTLPEFHSNKQVAELFGVSGEMVREFLSLLSLPENVQHMLEEQQLHLDQGVKLASLKKRWPERFSATAQVLAEIPSQDAREIIEYVIRNPDKSPEEAKDRVLRSKTVIEDEFHVVAVLTKQEFGELDRLAHKHKISPNELVTRFVREQLRRQTSG